MNREDIIRMAREAGMTVCRDEYGWGLLERFAALAVAAERDQILEMFNKEGLWDAEGIAATIRGET